VSLIYSDQPTLQRIALLLRRYHRLPFVSSGIIAGTVVENVLEQARSLERLGRYDFVDVVSRELRYGLQVKSSKQTSPLTWQRAKVPNSGELREASKKFESAQQELGTKILDYINSHVAKDLETYKLDEIGYARLVVGRDSAFYFERRLLDRDHPVLFNPSDFHWRWAEDRKATKEQRGSLSAYDRAGTKWFSWHSENQLHFINERVWWPQPGDPTRIDFPLNEPKIDLATLMRWLDDVEEARP
jgi:hypothetical protein